MQTYRKQYLGYDTVACAECGCAADPDFPFCRECGAGEDRVRSGGLSEGIHARVYEGISTQEEESVGLPPTRWWVYMFIDPRDAAPIYVGITKDLWTRHSAHMSSGESAVNEWMKMMSVRPLMLPVASFPTRQAARDAEERLIAFVPCLANRDVQATRKRVASASGWTLKVIEGGK